MSLITKFINPLIIIKSFGFTFGTIINSLLGLVFYIFIARLLGPSDFGNFAFLLGFGLLAAEVGDFGLGSALVRFGSGSELRGVFTLTFGQRIIAAVVFFLIAFLAGGNFYLSAMVAISLQFVSLITQTFLARQKYGFFVLTNVFGNLCRLGLVWVLWTMSTLTVSSTLWAFFGANFLAFVLGIVLVFIFFGLPFSLVEARKMFVPVWNFSRWIALSFGISSIGAKIDVPIIFALAGPLITGIYTSAQKLISVFMQIASSIEGIFAPKFSSDTQGKSYFKEYLYIAMLVSFGLLIMPIFSGFFITMIFGQKYLEAIPVFNFMSIALIPFFLSGPFSASVLYRYGKSNYHLMISVVQLAVSILGYFIFVPMLGAIGAVVATLFVNLSGLLIYIKFYLKLK